MCVCEGEVAVTRLGTAYSKQLLLVRGFGCEPCGGPFHDEVIGHLLMCNILGFLPCHVAERAVRLLRVMLSDECRIAVAGQAFAAKVLDALFRRGIAVRIVAGHAGHAAGTLAIAGALQQRLPLAGRTSPGADLAPVNEEPDILK